MTTAIDAHAGLRSGIHAKMRGVTAASAEAKNPVSEGARARLQDVLEGFRQRW